MIQFSRIVCRSSLASSGHQTKLLNSAGGRIPIGSTSGVISCSSHHHLASNLAMQQPSTPTTRVQQSNLASHLASFRCGGGSNNHHLSSNLAIFQQQVRCESSYRQSYPPPEKPVQPINILKDLRSLRRSPAPALLLGLSGLVPFCAAPAYMVAEGVYCPSLAAYHLGYGAVILSFLGGVRWGMAVEGESIPQTWLQYGWSVTPALIGWSALFLPVAAGYVTLISGLGVTCYLDLIESGYPDWFRGLRFLLTLVAVLSLWTALMCKLLVSNANNNATNNVTKNVADNVAAADKTTEPATSSAK